MAFERMNDDLQIISKLGDIPGADDGLSAQELKALFDKASLLLQGFINNKLIPEIEKQNVGLPIGGGTMQGPINMKGHSLYGLDDPTADDEAATRKFVETYVAENAGKDDLTPKAGFIYPLAAAVVPEGFLLCDGAAYSRTEYPELFAAIGTIYGEGDGATTFNVPDLRNRVPAGSSENHPAGNIVGEETHKLTVDEMPSHMHRLANTVGYGSGGFTGYVWSSTIPNYGNMKTEYVGGDQPHNNMQPTTYIHGYIIATGKGTGVSVADIILGAQAIPLGVEYGGTGATNAATARANLGITPGNIGALSMELVWENSYPNDVFVAQTLNLDLTAYSHIVVDFSFRTNIATTYSVTHLGKKGTVSVMDLSDAANSAMLYRTAKINDGGVEFSSTYRSGVEGSDDYMVPLTIYGIKGVLI